MQAAKAKIFISGNSQAVRLPKEFRLNVKEVFIRKEGDDIVLSPRPKTWDGFAEAMLGGLSDDFSTEGGLGEDVPRLEFDE